MLTKILIVVNEPWFFVSHRLPIARAALLLGYEVHVATKQGEGIEKIKREGIVCHEIPFKRSSFKPLDEVRTFVALVRLYKKLRPEIIHHVTIKPVLYGTFAARITNMPHIVNAISGLGFVFIAKGFIASLRRYFVSRAYKTILRKKNIRVIFQNSDDRNLFIKIGILKENQVIEIKGSGVDLEKFFPTPEQLDDQSVVVLVARMLWDKGIGEFVEAAKVLQQDGIKARFLLVGDIDEGNPRSITREQMEAWCNSGLIEWSGHSTDIQGVLAKANIVCLPSYREGLPKVLLEAAACGRAVITTDVPGCRDAIEPDVSGLLVQVRDVATLVNALRRLIDDEILRKRMGIAGRELAEREFNIQKVVDAHMAIYKEMTCL